MTKVCPEGLSDVSVEGERTLIAQASIGEIRFWGQPITVITGWPRNAIERARCGSKTMRELKLIGGNNE